MEKTFLARPRPVVLVIRDGWGSREETEGNAIAKGAAEYTRQLESTYPTTFLGASGEFVGLPKGTQGNSEVGHLTIGSGRIVLQPMVRIDRSISEKTFFSNNAFLSAIENCRKNGSTLHIAGLVQKEGVHSHISHCLALLDMCKIENFRKIALHLFTDGRDADPKNSISNVRIVEEKLSEIGFGKIATLCGRYYSMDRDKRWDRTRLAYDCIALGNSPVFSESSPSEELLCAYSCGETDEFLKPRKAPWYGGISSGDSFIFFNFRTDRTRQLTRALIEDSFEGWEREPKEILFVEMTEYYKPISKRAIPAFSDQSFENLLGQVVSDAGLAQLRISETEKYAHVTFFFNGQKESPEKGEERILIPSPKVPTYDLSPEMSALEIALRLESEIASGKWDLIVANIVNGDLVGHTGKWDAILQAVKAVDSATEQIVRATLKAGGVAILSADHGNCEDKTGKFPTSHTTHPVPFTIVSGVPELKNVALRSGGGLADIAPTVLKILGIKKPREMTGESLF